VDRGIIRDDQDTRGHGSGLRGMATIEAWRNWKVGPWPIPMQRSEKVGGADQFSDTVGLIVTLRYRIPP
jgi:hypothetical protein